MKPTKERLGNHAALVQDLLSYDLIHSCLNCGHHLESGNFTCQKFKVTPPPRVIFFSCGKDWEDIIPF